MPIVSILVPIYGVEKYIEQCAHTLFQQSYSDIEFVFVNDCTKDRSVEILQQVIKQYPERQAQIRLIEHEHNKGLGGARHTAFAACKGRYVMHVDSDDLLPRDSVRLLVEAAEQTGADIVDGALPTGRMGKFLPCIMPVVIAITNIRENYSARTSRQTAFGDVSIASPCLNHTASIASRASTIVKTMPL